MGNQKSSTLRPEVVADLKNTTAFTHQEINDLYRQFRHDCGSNISLTMDVEHFKNMYREVFPTGDPDKFAEHVFRTYDREKKGEINFREFMTALSVQLKGNLESKLEWAFNLYDTSSTGYITREDTMELIRSMQSLHAGALPAEDRVTPTQLTAHIFDKADKDNSNRIMKHEFVQAAMMSKTLQTMLEGASRAASSPYNKRKERSGSFGKPRSNSLRESPPKGSPKTSPKHSPKNSPRTRTEVNIP